MALPSTTLSSTSVPSAWINPYQRTRTNPLIDYDIGGVDLQDPSQGQRVKVWKSYWEAGTIYVTPDDGGAITPVINVIDCKEVSFTFDQNMRYTCCYMDNGGLKLYWYDSTIPGMTTTTFPNAISGMIRLDDKRTSQGGTSDILLVYIEGGQLKLRQQRDRFLIEYVIKTTDAKSVVQLGMNTKWRIQIQLAGELPECVAINDRVSVACVIADMATRAKVPYDATDLLDTTMIGYRVDSQQSARSWIEPLMTAYYFDVFEESGTIKFRTRHRDIVATFTDDDVAANVIQTGNEMSPDKTSIARTQESELPRVVNIGYRDIDAEHEPGIQTATRLASGAVSEATINLPIVMNKDEAKQKAEEILRKMWLNRETISFSIPYSEITIKPTDKVILDVDGVQNLVRINSVSYQLSGILKCEGVVESLEGLSEYSSYTDWRSDSEGVSGGWTTSESPAIPTPVTGYWMDIPLLRDTHEEGGVYVATGTTGAFRGGFIYTSVDDGVTWQFAARAERAITGVTNTVLGAPVRPSIVDWGKTVRVTLTNPSDELYSISNATAVQRTNNAALIGDEIVIFEQATLVSPGVYDLTGLHRGLRGTNVNMSTHANGERFVLLDNSVVRLPLPNGRIGTSLKIRYLAYGQALEDVTPQIVTYTGRSLETYSVAHLKATNAGGGNYSINWIRRTRIDGEWRDYFDAALSEATEEYTVEVWRSAAMISTTNVTTNSATVAAIAGDTVKVYQRSAVVGTGFANEVILT